MVAKFKGGYELNCSQVQKSLNGETGKFELAIYSNDVTVNLEDLLSKLTTQSCSNIEVISNSGKSCVYSGYSVRDSVVLTQSDYEFTISIRLTKTCAVV